MTRRLWSPQTRLAAPRIHCVVCTHTLCMPTDRDGKAWRAALAKRVARHRPKRQDASGSLSVFAPRLLIAGRGLSQRACCVPNAPTPTQDTPAACPPRRSQYQPQPRRPPSTAVWSRPPRRRRDATTAEGSVRGRAAALGLWGSGALVRSAQGPRATQSGRRPGRARRRRQELTSPTSCLPVRVLSSDFVVHVLAPSWPSDARSACQPQHRLIAHGPVQPQPQHRTHSRCARDVRRARC